MAGANVQIDGARLAGVLRLVSNQLEPQIARAFLRSVGRLNRSDALRKVLTEMERGVYPSASALEGLWLDLEQIRALVAQAYLHAAQAGSAAVSAMVPAKLTFNATNPWAVESMSQLSHRLVATTSPTQESIRQVLDTIVRGGGAIDDAVPLIRRLVGLLPQHAQAVANFDAGLRKRGVNTAARRAQVAAYSTRLRTYRAWNIARTEIMHAQNLGLDDAWVAGVDAGMIDPDPEFTKRVWITAKDEKRCEICADLHGRLAAIGKSFEGKYGVFERPAAHPQCRCTMGLVFAPAAASFIEELQKGDYPGHPFRGNQYVKVPSAGTPDPARQLGYQDHPVSAYLSHVFISDPIPPITPTMDRLEKEFRRYMPNAKVSLMPGDPGRGVSEADIEALAKTVRKVAQDFPETLRGLDAFRFGYYGGELGETAGGATTFAIAQLANSTKVRFIHGIGFNAASKPSLHDASVDSGYLTTDSGLSGTFLHEMGHAVYNRAKHGWLTNGFTKPREPGDRFQFEGLVTNTTFRWVMGVDNLWSPVYPSRYAKEHFDEHFAETFAYMFADKYGVRKGKDRQLNPDMVSFVTEVVALAEHDAPLRYDKVVKSELEIGAIIEVQQSCSGYPADPALIEKGDFEGHPFRGNQYVKVGSRSQPTAVHQPKKISVPGGNTSAAWDAILTDEAKLLQDPKRFYPERYAPNKVGGGVHLKEGEIEARMVVAWDDEGHIVGRMGLEYQYWTPMPMDKTVADYDQSEMRPGYGLRPFVKVGPPRQLQHVFRVMDRREYDEAQARGFIQTKGEENIGNEGTVASTRSTGAFYFPMEKTKATDAVIVRIKVDPNAEWYFATDEYAKNRQPIPFELVDAVVELDKPGEWWVAKARTDLRSRLLEVGT